MEPLQGDNLAVGAAGFSYTALLGEPLSLGGPSTTGTQRLGGLTKLGSEERGSLGTAPSVLAQPAAQVAYPGAYVAPVGTVAQLPQQPAQLLLSQGGQPVAALQQYLLQTQQQQQQQQQQQLFLQRAVGQAQAAAQYGGQLAYTSLNGQPFAQYAYASFQGHQPAAKRQAVDPRQMAMLQSQAASNPALYSLLQQKAVAAAPVYGAQQYAATANGGTMRVDISRSGEAWRDGQFVAEDTTAKDHTEEVMKRCEDISRKMKQQLGKYAEGDRFAATDTDEEKFRAVTQAQLIEACGDTSRYLKPYQIVGVNFLLLLYRQKVGGAILADEMGLGKTSQLINYLGAIRKLENDPGPHLVVVPASLLENWQRELHRWCPAMKVVVYYGKHRAAMRKRLVAIRDKMAKGEDVDDDISDLTDPTILAELHQSDKLEEAAAQAAADEAADEDPYGYSLQHDSDDEFDIDREEAGEEADLAPDVPGPTWDIHAATSPAPFNVMLTCYTLFERDSPEQRLDRAFLEKWRWSHLIMDEAHALKNRNASRTMRLRRTANASNHRIMMTGTPLQNDLVELQNLLHFLLPTVFAAQGFEDWAELLQGDEAEIQELTDRMKQLLTPFVLRRLKTEVADQLTEKTHVLKMIEMTAEQGQIYTEAVQTMRSQITGKAAAAAADKSDKGVEKFLRTLGAKKISHMFTHLRKIAQHPLLVRTQYTDDQVARIAEMAFNGNIFTGNVTLKRVHEELLTYSDFSLHAFCYNHGPDFAPLRLDPHALMHSTKFCFLAQLLPELKARGSRPLIFSQWTAVLDIMEWLMDVLQLPYVRLDGSTAVDDRLATVDRFNHSDDVFAFLLSTRAGGQGLNLTGADTVILHDVDFNPQIDKQAEDRCHRLGQTKPVKVYRLITKNSVDQNIYNLSQRKLRLDAAVLDGITYDSKAGKGEERQQMGAILHSLLTDGAGAGVQQQANGRP